MGEHREEPMIHELQHDILTKDLSDNPLMPSHIIPALDKSLKTGNKDIIGAVNELLSEINSLSDTTTNAMDQNYEVIGDFVDDPSMVEDLKKIDGTILKSLTKIYKTIVGDLDDPEEIDDLAGSINEAIRYLYDHLAELDKSNIYHSYTEYHNIDPNDPHRFRLDYKAIPKSISIYINGVRYGINSLIYNPITNTIRWTFDAENGGFDLIESFSVKIEYDMIYSVNDIEDVDSFIGSL